MRKHVVMYEPLVYLMTNVFRSCKMTPSKKIPAPPVFSVCFRLDNNFLCAFSLELEIEKRGEKKRIFFFLV